MTMNSANRTLAFVLVAACSVGIAVGAHRMYLPSADAQKTDVGTAFYPEFQDPLSATYLGVAAYDADASKVDTFVVEKRDGEWRIPSHHNYPADAKDRVARTAASMMGVTRGQLVDETGASHQRLNLLDPLDEKVVGTEGRGSRITLKADDTVLTDLIIGKQAEGSAGADRYYVRRADEQRVYIAEIRPDLSTKFTDWIRPNVLDATASTFRRISFDRYSVEEAQGKLKLVPGAQSILSRDSASDEWKLEGIEDGKKLKTSVVNQITSALSDMKIVGVRPKTPGIAAVLKGDPNAGLSSIDRFDMRDKGYFLDPNGGLVSKEGSFQAGTSEGIIYILSFGKMILGDDVDIEIGSSRKLSEEEAAKALEELQANEAAATSESNEDQPADEKQDAGQKDGEEPRKENRILFVTAQVDEELLGAPPVEPEKPTPPPGYQPKEKPADSPAAPMIPGFNTPQDSKPAEKPATPPAEPKKETSSTTPPLKSFAGPSADAPENQKAGTPAGEAQPEGQADEKPAPNETQPEQQKPADARPEEPKPATAEEPAKPAAAEEPAPPAAEEAKKPEPPADPFAEYEAALAKYEQELDEYKVRKNEHDEKLKKARDREKALNARFADWYYVIPADVFNTINVKPEELVEPEMTPAADPAADSTTPAPEATPPAATPSESPASPKEEAPKEEAKTDKPATTGQSKETPEQAEPERPAEPGADAPGSEPPAAAADPPADSSEPPKPE